MATYIDPAAALISQWRSSPKLRAVVAETARPRDDLLAALDRLADQLDIETATGPWLDRLAGRLGMSRPFVSDPTIDKRFGYDSAGLGWDQAPYRGAAENDAVYPLNDVTFRRLIAARAITVTSDTSLASFARTVRLVDPAAIIDDQRNMTVNVHTTRGDLLTTARTAGALAAPLALRIVYVTPGRFGFDAAGVAFDQAPFDAA